MAWARVKIAPSRQTGAVDSLRRRKRSESVELIGWELEKGDGVVWEFVWEFEVGVERKMVMAEMRTI